MLDGCRGLMLPRMMSRNRTICVYCGSRNGRNPNYEAAARKLGLDMADKNIGLVFGAGTYGIMGAVADAVVAGGGKVTGVIPDFLKNKEANEADLKQFDELIVTGDMHERKHIMFRKSGAFVALPGGIGTLEEIIEIMTWAQLGRHNRPMVLANIDGFWDPLLKLIDHMAGEGFLHTSHLVKPLVIDNAANIVDAVLKAWESIDRNGGDAEIIEKL
ncbi:MAG: cytokinin riboside 5'-monophosphate phosphoribohydrolase [Rhizobiaceae bacterium MnEN-MB40S]|nr:MAG: cytokinin riboside 5'-monophosphate phosphoribohydrolase [Rhizobiaceae bacterium MnEN-MB40S]